MKYLSLTVITLAMALSACTKSRTAKLPEDLAKDLFTRSEIESATIEIETAAKLENLSENQKMKAINEKQKVAVKSYKSPSRLKFMFKNLDLAGIDKSSKVRLKVTQDFVTAYKVVANLENLSALESALPTMKDHDAAILVPLFKYAVEDFGTVSRVKNDLGEKTSTLSLNRSNWSSATHVKISTTTDARNLITFPSTSEDELQEVFLVDKIDGKIITVAELKSVLNLNTFMLPITDEATKVLVRVGPDGLHIFEITQRHSLRLTEEEEQFLKTGRSRGDLGGCPEEVKASLPESEKTNCVVAARGKVDLEFVQATLDKTSSGKDYAADISFKPAKYQKQTRLIKISQGQKVEAIKPSAELNGAVEMAQLKNKEFFLRRTVEDAANTMFIPPGTSGETVLVDITFDKSSAVIRRLESILAVGFNKPIDREELMRVPAKYFKLKKTDELGRALVNPTLDEVDYAQADLVKLDWENASTMASNSPIYFLGFSGCITGFNSVEIPVSSIDDQLHSENKIGFSLDYNFGVTPECAAQYLSKSGYALDEAFQSTQKVRERVSLIANDHKSDKGNQELPYQVQKALGFGGFTIANRSYDRFGNHGTLGTEKAFPMVYNLKNGKVTYILGGVSKNNPRRAQIIQGTKDVVADMNLALKEALAGTSLYNGEDTIELKVEGEDIEAGHLGDLDRNYLWYEERALESGPLGVAQPAAHPRSGYIIAANVIIYGGALNQQLGYFADRKKVEEEFDALKNSLIEEARQGLESVSAQTAEQTAFNQKKAQLISDIDKGQLDSITKLGLSEKLNLDLGIKTEVNQKHIQQSNFGLNLLKKFARTKLAKAKSLSLTDKAVTNQKVYSAEAKIKVAQRNAVGKSKGNASAFKGLSKNMISEIFERVEKAKAFNDERMVEIISTEAFLKYHSKELDKLEANRIAKRLVTLKMAKQVRDSMMGQRPSCIRDANLNMNGDATDSVEELFSNSYKATLAHEIGHSLGLTHNFIASADKSNFGDKSYSSVMDYMDESSFKYTGMGSYDIHAFRALYTGRIETNSGALVNLNEVLTAKVGEDISKVTRLTDEEIAEFDFKKYKYCNDYDVGSEPLCTRFDLGASAHEAVKNYIKSRETFYLQANGIRNRMSFDVMNTGNYISAVMGDLSMIRSYLDGFLLSVFTGASEDVVTDYMQAALESYQYLSSVVRAPETDLAAGDSKRLETTVIPFFAPAETDEQGKPVPADQLEQAKAAYEAQVKELGNRFAKVTVLNNEGKPQEIPVAIVIVDKKNSYDRYISARDIRLDTRGYQYDKAIAALMLGARTSAGAQFEQGGFPISFIEFEAFLLGAKGKDSPTAKMLIEIMNQRVSPAIYDTVLGTMGMDPATYNTSVSDIQSDVASDVAVFSLAPTSMDGISGVNSYLFRVGNKEGTNPKGTLAINRLEEKRNSSTGYHYYQTDSADLTNPMIQDLYSRRILLEEKPAKAAQMIGQAADDYISLYADLTAKGIDASILEGDLAELQKTLPNLSDKLKKVVTALDKMAPTVGSFLKTAGYDKETQNQARTISETAVKVSAGYRLGFAQGVFQLTTAEAAARAVLANPNSTAEEKSAAVSEYMKAKENLGTLKDLTVKISEQESYMLLGFIGATDKITETSTKSIMLQLSKTELAQVYVQVADQVLMQGFMKEWGKEVPDANTDFMGYIEFLMQFNAYKEAQIAPLVEGVVIAMNPKLKPSDKAADQLTAEEQAFEAKKKELRDIYVAEQSAVLGDAVLGEIGKAGLGAEQVAAFEKLSITKADAAAKKLMTEVAKFPEYIDASETLKARWNSSFQTIQTLSQKFQVSSLEASK